MAPAIEATKADTVKRAEYRQALERSFAELQALQEFNAYSLRKYPKLHKMLHGNAEDILILSATLRGTLDSKELDHLPTGRLEHFAREVSLRTQVLEIVAHELAPAADKANRANVSYFRSIMIPVLGGVVTAYLTSSMPVSAQAAITAATMLGGGFVGYNLTKGNLDKTTSNVKKVFAKVEALNQDVVRQHLLTQEPSQEKAPAELALAAEPDLAPCHTAKIAPSPLAALAATKAATTHAAAVQAKDGQDCGCKLR